MAKLTDNERHKQNRQWGTDPVLTKMSKKHGELHMAVTREIISSGVPAKKAEKMATDWMKGIKGRGR